MGFAEACMSEAMGFYIKGVVCESKFHVQSFSVNHNAVMEPTRYELTVCIDGDIKGQFVLKGKKARKAHIMLQMIDDAKVLDEKEKELKALSKENEKLRDRLAKVNHLSDASGRDFP